MTHPSREADVRRLVELHPELDLRVAVDPEPGRGHSLGTALLAWSMVKPGATHHLVLQDDIVFCERFVELMFTAVRTHTDAAVSLFAEWGARAGDLVRLALLRGQGYAAVADRRAALATVLPGAFRRYLPAPVLDRLGPYASDLFGLAVHTGAEAAAGLDRDTLLAIAHHRGRSP
jgi:hypothetical protein